MTELSCRGLRKAFGGLVVTDDLALSVASGELHALIGPNGAGKTTALAQLSGELRPDAGSVWLDDVDITDLSLPQRVHAGVARSYQISSVFRDFTARENVELALQAMDRHSFRFFRPAARNAARIERRGGAPRPGRPGGGSHHFGAAAVAWPDAPVGDRHGHGLRPPGAPAGRADGRNGSRRGDQAGRV